MNKKVDENIKKINAKEITEDELRKQIKNLDDDEILVCDFIESDEE